MTKITPETIQRIEAAINLRSTSEVRLKVEHGEITVLAVKVTQIK